MHNMLRIHSNEPPLSLASIWYVPSIATGLMCPLTHTQKYTIFNIFTVAYYSQTSLHQSNSKMINIRQQLFVFNRSFVEKSKKGHKSTVNK